MQYLQQGPTDHTDGVAVDDLAGVVSAAAAREVEQAVGELVLEGLIYAAVGF